MTLALIIVALMGILCLVLAGFCAWMQSKTAEGLQQALVKEQASRLAEREASFRREKFLIAVLLRNDPVLANTISKMPAEQAQEPETFFADLAGHGEASLSRRPV